MRKGDRAGAIADFKQRSSAPELETARESPRRSKRVTLVVFQPIFSSLSHQLTRTVAW